MKIYLFNFVAVNIYLIILEIISVNITKGYIPVEILLSSILFCILIFSSRSNLYTQIKSYYPNDRNLFNKVLFGNREGDVIYKSKEFDRFQTVDELVDDTNLQVEKTFKNFYIIQGIIFLVFIFKILHIVVSYFKL